jgi:hypothetical protein
VVLAGLGAYAYFVDSKRPAPGTETKEKPFTVTAEQIEEFQLKSATGETSRVQKSGETWKIVEPESTDADSTAMSTLSSQLASVEIQRVVDENPGDLKQYGLNPPRIDVAYRLKGEKEFRHLFVGDKTPTGGDLFAKTPDKNRVFLIASYFDSTLNKTPFDLRDKSVLKFDREKADGLLLVKGTKEMQFSRMGTDWKITKPAAARGDYAALEGLLTRLSSAQMDKIITSDPKDLKDYGLDKPAQTATVIAGSSRATLLIGNKTEGGMFAKDASRPMVFVIEPTFATDLDKDVSEFRRKDMFDARSFSTNRIEIKRGSEMFAFEKTKGSDGKEEWKDAAGKMVDLMKVEDLITKLSNLRAQSFEASPNAALKTPTLTVTVRFDESKTETVNLARAGSDAFGSRADEPGDAKLEASVVDEVVKALDALK